LTSAFRKGNVNFIAAIPPCSVNSKSTDKIATQPEGVLKAMVLSKLKWALTTVLLLATLGLGTGLMTALDPSQSAAGETRTGATHAKPATLGLAEFQKLKPLLDVKNQPWATIPWKYSITEARKLAAKTRKPIFMVINTGNCLGCV
jgi:hypothetical protein